MQLAPALGEHHRPGGRPGCAPTANTAALATRSLRRRCWSSTPSPRSQTGQQLLLGAYSALEHRVAAGNVEVFNRHEMQDVVVIDGEARGVIVRNLVTGEIERHAADAVVLASGGYTNVYYLSTNAMGSNVTATRAHKRGAYFANLLHADPPDPSRKPASTSRS